MLIINQVVNDLLVKAFQGSFVLIQGTKFYNITEEDVWRV